MKFIFVLAAILFLLQVQVAVPETGDLYIATSQGVYKRADSALEWTAANTGILNGDCYAAATDPLTPGVVYAGCGTGIYKSLSGGSSWYRPVTGLSDPVVLSVAIHPRQTQTVYVGTAAGGILSGKSVFKSVNGGTNWAESNSGIPTSIVNVVRIDPVNPSVVYAGTNFAGVYKSTNSGATWTSAGTLTGFIYDIAIDPANPATLYAALGGCSFNCLHAAGIHKSVDAGATWTPVNTGLTDLQPVSLAIDPSDPSVLYASTRIHGLFKSTNAGANWTSIEPNLTYMQMFIDPRNPRVVYAGGVGLFKSTNGGASWASSSSGLPASTYVNGFAMELTGLRFVPITPCRVMDTRDAYGPPNSFPYGPPRISPGAIRIVPLPQTPLCNVPSEASAYMLNATVDTIESQTGPVDSLTIWPSGDVPPLFHTVRTTTGGYIANSAIVSAGTLGGINVTSTHATNLILDLNGYFTRDPAVSGLLYYPILPCRAVDTRGALYSTLQPPFGNQRFQARENRTLRLPSSPACQITPAAAYSLQLTLVPGELTNGGPVAFVTVYPTGSARPNVSTMNSIHGYVVANSAVVPADSNGRIDVYAYDATNLIIDVNGYFAPDDGTDRGLLYYPVPQCRLLNTQDVSYPGAFGPPALVPQTDRTFVLPAGRCPGLPAAARAFALNTSVVPAGPMPYLSLWPAGSPWPNVSQLNAFQGQTVANSAIVPAGPNGAINVRVAATTHATVEVSGYFR